MVFFWTLRLTLALLLSNGIVTGSIAKAGSFKGSALIVPTGVDAGLIAVALRGRGIFVEGLITVPAAAEILEAEESAQATEEPEERHRRHEAKR